MKKNLSHLDDNARPRMVDVSHKAVTRRAATAEARVRFPADVWETLQSGGFSVKKGSVLNVAVIAGTMGTKRTADLIPFCHSLPLEKCDFSIEPLPGEPVIRISCTVSCEARTGVEMEALTGATVAALTIYDMTKSLGHGACIESVRLLEKSGGKRDYSTV